ncbi:hypothetical protein H9Q70_014692, partial [Fusarium xylarioides]
PVVCFLQLSPFAMQLPMAFVPRSPALGLALQSCLSSSRLTLPFLLSLTVIFFLLRSLRFLVLV